MGFQYRKRTKGKNGWFNFSYSARNGFGASTSVKVGGITYNFGGKRANRTTVDLGNGIKYVRYGPSKAKRKTSKQTTPRTAASRMTRGDWYRILQFTFALVLITTVVVMSWPWKVAAATISVLWLCWAVIKQNPTPPIEEQEMEAAYRYYRECDIHEYQLMVDSLRKSHTKEAVDDFEVKVNRSN